MTGVLGAEELLSAIKSNDSFETLASVVTIGFFVSATTGSNGGVSGVPTFELLSKILDIVEDELELEDEDSASKSRRYGVILPRRGPVGAS